MKTLSGWTAIAAAVLVFVLGVPATSSACCNECFWGNSWCDDDCWGEYDCCFRGGYYGCDQWYGGPGYYGYYGCYSQWYGPPTYYGYAPAPNYQPAQQAAPSNTATVRLVVPADAKVRFDERETKQSGTDRLFETPPLTPGSDYFYQVTARWQEGGKEVVQTRTLRVRANETSTLDFTTPRP
jgi:uncharacterized protein (TIGR03000 family)